MSDYNQLQINNQEKTFAFFDCLIRAVKETRTIVIKCENETAKAREAMLSNDRDKMLRVLQEYMRKYYDKIIKSNFAKIVPVDKKTYEQLAIQQLQLQLQIIIGFIYRYEATHSAAKETIKKCLKKILENSGKFTKKEIEILLM